MNPVLPTLRALEVFLRGFSATRSFTRPYEVKEIDPTLWLLSDVPSSSKQPERTPEMIAYHAEPENVIANCARLSLSRYFLCALLDDAGTAADAIAAYKGVGYRLQGREPFFVLNTAARIRFEDYSIRRVTTAWEAEAVAKAARSRQILPQHLTEADADCRLYAAMDRETPVGWVRSIRTHLDRAWVSNLFVRADYRRRGIGRSLMTAMLDEDAQYGVKWSVLLASSTGAKLYPRLGYVEQGLLLLFTPRKSLAAT